MLWYKSWLDTRWRFLLGLALLLVFACGTVVSFSTVQELVRSVRPSEIGRQRGTASGDAKSRSRSCGRFAAMPGRNGSSQNFPWPAHDLRSAARQRQSARGDPAAARCSRWRCPCRAAAGSAARAAAGLAEFFVLALASRASRSRRSRRCSASSFPLGEALVYGTCAFVGASAFFGIAVYLSSLVNDVWRPLLITCFAAVAHRRVGWRLPEGHGLFTAMAGGDYFEDGSLPWIELLVSAAVAAGFVYAAAANVAQRDF